MKANDPSRSLSHSSHEGNVPASPYKQCTLPSRWCQVSRVAPRQETYLVQIYIHITEATGDDPHQYALATWTEVKILIYKAILKPIVTYGIHMSGTASTSNIEIIKRFQSEVLLMIVDALTVKGEICWYNSQYSARLSILLDVLVANLMVQPENRRLRRHLPNAYHIHILSLLLVFRFESASHIPTSYNMPSTYQLQGALISTLLQAIV
jgi:hypothetical protein